MKRYDQITTTNDRSLRDLILQKLQEKGLATVTIEFDGACDEGQIEYIACKTVDGSDGSLNWPCEIPGKVRVHGHPSASSAAGQSIGAGASRPMTMHELVEDWAYDLLNQVEVDWVNNDGGFGEIVIDVNKGTVDCDMNQRFTDIIETHHEF